MNENECALFPTPTWLTVLALGSKLLRIGAVGQHAPDLLAARTTRLKNDMASVRRPRREVVASAVVRQLHPLLAGDIHYVDIQRSRRSRAVFAKPRKRQELSVGGP